MFFKRSVILAYAGFSLAGPALHQRAVTALNQAATAEAQKRDNTATRAFSNTQIKTSDGRCLFVDPLSGDFRANLLPVQVGTCNGSTAQQWDIITSGIHNNQPGNALVVSSLTQGCLNFDPRRAAGNQVIIFSCGGRADGEGKVTDSQLFPFSGGAGPLTLTPANSKTTCLTVKGNLIDQANCNGGATQSFTLGNGAVGKAASAPAKAAPAKAATSAAPVVASAAAQVCSASTVTVTAAPVTVTVTAAAAQSVVVQSVAPAQAIPPAAPAAPANVNGVPSVNPTEQVPVSRAGGTLNPTAAAEANQRDATATRAFSSVSIRAPNGQCLFVDPTAGDFRENLIPVQLVTCSGSPNEKFDFITAGKHNNAPGTAIIVSSLTQGCISFDGRRAADDNVTIFSCGGRADGEGQTNSGQTIPFSGQKSFAVAPVSENGKTCIVPGNGRIVGGACTGSGQNFTIV